MSLQNLLLQNEVYVPPFSKIIREKLQAIRTAAYQVCSSTHANGTTIFSDNLCILTLLIKTKCYNGPKTKRTAIHEATKSGVSASTDNKAVCTLPNHVSSRSRKDTICGIPKTLGWTHETWTVPSTWSIIPSMRWTCSKLSSSIKQKNLQVI